MIKKLFVYFIFSISIFMCLNNTYLYASSIKWYTDFNEGQRLAKEQNKIIMLDLYTDWCGWCKELDKRTFVHSTVVRKSTSFIAIKIDAEENRVGATLVERYNISGYPAILFLDADGNLLSMVGGFVEGVQFAKEMDKALEMPAMIEKIKQGDNKNLEAVDYYISQNQVDMAYNIFNQMVSDDELISLDGSVYGASVSTDFVVSKYDDIALAYANALGELYKAKSIYEMITSKYTNTRHIFDADMKIVNIMIALDNSKSDIINYVNNIALKRKNLPTQYKNMYENFLKEINS